MFIAEHTLETSDPVPCRTHLRLASGFAQAYALGTLLYVAGGVSVFPVFFGMAAGGFMFCMAPGLALYSLLSLRRDSRFSSAVLLVLSCSLGFTFNFLWNIAVYLLGFSIVQATMGYLVATTAMYGGLLAYWWWRGHGQHLLPGFRDWLPTLGILAVLAVLIWWFSRLPPAGFYIEELMVLRKVFENSRILSDNISFQPGAHTTYYFIPFYLMVAMTAQFAGVDVFNAVVGLWPFTTAVSLLCVTMIVRSLGGGWTSPAIFLAGGILGTLLLPHPTSNLFTLLAPFPDRYALAAGVLIPLALFHFMVHVGEDKVSMAAFVGLVYLIVEITFIHARETLYFLVIVLVGAAMAALDWSRNRALLSRIFGLVMVVTGLLLLYRLVNLSLQPELDAFIGLLRKDMMRQLAEALSLHGWPAYFGIPQFHGPNVPDAFDYGDRFGAWRQFREIAFLPAVVCLLPLYACLVSRPSLLLAPVALASFGLFSLFQGTRLAIGIAVGAPFVFDIFSVLFLLAALVMVDLLRMVAVLAVNTGTGRLYVLLLALFAFVIFLYLTNRTPYATGHPYSEMLCYLATLAVAIWRLYLWRRSDGDIVRPLPGMATAIVRLACMASPQRVVLVGISMMSAITLYAALVTRQEQASTQVANAATPFRLGTSLAENMRELDRRRLFAVSTTHNFSLPESMVEFIHTQIPLGQVWFGSHTAAVMLISPQYSPVVSFGGSMEEGFEANNNFLSWFHGVDDRERLRTSRLADKAGFGALLMDSSKRERLLDYLDREGIDWIIAIPGDMAIMERVFSEDESTAARFDKMVEAEGYVIYAYRRDRKNDQAMRANSAATSSTCSSGMVG